MSTPSTAATPPAPVIKPPPLLSVRDLQVRTGAGRTLVRNVSFEVAAGEIVGIVGESGSGKTMTARAIARVLPDGLDLSGEILFRGTSIYDLSPRKLRDIRASGLAMVLQDPFTSLNPLQTVRRHLVESLPRSVRRDRTELRRQITSRLEEVGLRAETADRYPFELSGGMRQRVAIAAALAKDPQLLIADEPTTALDATTQAQVLDLLRRLQRERGMGLILITHDLPVAFSVCDRIAVTYAGTVLETAPAAALAASARHPYSLSLMLAQPSMTQYQAELTFAPGSVPSADSVMNQCAFAARCEWSTSACVTEAPSMTRHIDDQGAVRESACIRADDLGTELGKRLRASTEAKAVPAAMRAEAESRPLLRVSDLRKVYRSQSMLGSRRESVAVDGVSFTVGEGEAVGLLGETGSGKSTIARCIVGLSKVSGGSIELGGVDISDYRSLSGSERASTRLMVQMVFQDPYSSLNPALRVGDALGEALGMAGDSDPGRPTSAVELLELVGLPSHYATRRPSALSGGERQRVAIARAVAVRPRLLICDEPVAALDVSVQAQVLAVLRDIRAQFGTAMLFITHDLAVVRQMTDRSIVLRAGHVVEAGTTADLLDSPSHPYTRGLVEASTEHALRHDGRAPNREHLEQNQVPTN